MIRFKFHSDTNLDHFLALAEKSGDVYTLNHAARVVCFYSTPTPAVVEAAADLGGEEVNPDG